MAIRCFRCKGIIPDVTFNGVDRLDCKNHKKVNMDVDFEEYRKMRVES